MVFEANTNHKPDSGNGTAVQAEVNTRLLGGGGLAREEPAINDVRTEGWGVLS